MAFLATLSGVAVKQDGSGGSGLLV